MSDLMHLRRLSITRRVVLSLQRKTLMAQLTMSDRQVLNPTESILNVEELTNELRQNAIEDKKIFYKVARAVHRGVGHGRTSPVFLVHFVQSLLMPLSKQLGHSSESPSAVVKAGTSCSGTLNFAAERMVICQIAHGSGPAELTDLKLVCSAVKPMLVA